MEEKIITRYKDGKGKQRSHAYLNGKYKKAIANEFYFEAMMIAYNLVEDRLLAFLHYAGIVNRDADKLKISKRINPSIRSFLGKKENERINIKNISVKLELIKALAEAVDCTDEYISAVSAQMEKSVGRNQICEFTQRCTEWKDMRNKFVHGLANKNPDEVEEYAKTVAEEGYKLARELDNMVGRFSKNNTIRKRFHIQ